jgi:hypothetical protein
VLTAISDPGAYFSALSTRFRIASLTSAGSATATARGSVETSIVAAPSSGASAYDARNDRGNVDDLPRSGLSPLQTREVDQPLDQRPHAAALLPKGREDAFADPRRIDRTVLEHIEIAHDDGERRAQFVAGVSDDLPSSCSNSRSILQPISGTRRIHQSTNTTTIAT